MTLVEMLLVMLLLIVLGAVIIPNFMKARRTAAKNACINNLRQIDAAKEGWGLEHKKTAGEDANMTQINRYLKGGAPVCPGGGIYTYGKIGSKTTCSIGGEGHTL